MESILDLYIHTDIWLLIFCRIMCSLLFLPIMEETKLPALAKGGIGMTLTLIVFFTIPVQEIAYNATLLGYSFLIIKECITGIILSFSILVFFQIYHFVGQLLGMQGGLSMSMMFDPVNNTQVPVLGKFYALGFSVIFLISGGYHWFITQLVESFKVIPVAQTVFRPDLLGAVVHAVGLFWETSFKLSVPILAVIFIVDCGLGILARTVPQMNMFVIGLPLKLIILLVLLITTIELLPAFNLQITDQMVETFFNLLQGMIP